MTERIVTDADILDLKARLGATMDAWVGELEVVDHEPAPEPVLQPPANPAAVPADGKVVLSWEAPAGAAPIGYRYGRDGTDAGGAGPWSGDLGPDARTATLDKLVNGRTYEVALYAVYPDGQYIGVSVAVTPMGPVGPIPPPPGTVWLSGVADDSVSRIHQWAAFRGQPTTYARVWADTPSAMESLSRMGEVTSSGYSGALDVACGGPSDWAGAANGDFDQFWVKQCRKALSLWGNLTRLDLSMAHEFNNGYPWKVSGDEQAHFRTAWARWYKIVQAELVTKGKNAKVVLSCNSDTNSGWTVAAGLPDPSTFDILGCDFYNFWPSLNTQAAWDANKNLWKGGTPRGIQAWIDFAARIGKPISFPEWGLAPSGNFPVDDPFFVRKMREVFASIAPTDPYRPGPGKLAGEAYFNAWPEHGQIYPTSVNATNARAAYTSLTWGTAQ